MIAIHTNVLLRHVLQDDIDQSPKASKLIEKNEQVLITDVVLVETIWTLLGKKYQANRDDIIKLVSNLLGERSIQFENPHAIWAALRDFQEEGPLYDEAGRKLRIPDFADPLIINKARLTARQSNETLTAIYTFDSGALRITGTRSP